VVKTIIHTESKDPQISRLKEFFLVANRIRRTRRYSRQGFDKLRSRPNLGSGGACLPAQTSSKDPPSANGSFALPVQGINDPPLAPSDSLGGNSLSKEEKNAIQASKNSVALSNTARCQLPNKIAQVVPVTHSQVTG
jgi:hypothetical protein